MIKIIPACDRYKKVTVITDPMNPENDLMNQAYSHGECVSQFSCSDGFVMLIRLPESNEEINESIQSSD